MDKSKGNFGIIVSGGPAPGINSVIASVVYTATGLGYDVYGFTKGLVGIVETGSKSAKKLTPDDVSPIQNKGGSILRTIRYNPFAKEDDQKKFFQALKDCNIDKLVMIGGEGTAYLALQIIKSNTDIQVVHIPKTIDNDLILPNQHPSFGFETARQVGTQLMSTIITEAKTTDRWFIVKTMGRNAGFLALGLGMAAGASLTLIPEQFSKGTTPDEVADVILNTIKKRYYSGKTYGTVVLAEGIIDLINPESLNNLEGITRDPIGRINFSEVDLEDIIVQVLKEKLKKEKISIRLKPENIGYVLRCAEPISFDIEYTRFLGYGAVKFLLEGKTGITVVKNYDALDYVQLENMSDYNGNIKSRKIDLESDLYKVACNFMFK